MKTMKIKIKIQQVCVPMEERISELEDRKGKRNKKKNCPECGAERQNDGMYRKQRHEAYREKV